MTRGRLIPLVGSVMLVSFALCGKPHCTISFLFSEFESVVRMSPQHAWVHAIIGGLVFIGFFSLCDLTLRDGLTTAGHAVSGVRSFLEAISQYASVSFGPSAQHGIFASTSITRGAKRNTRSQNWTH